MHNFQNFWPRSLMQNLHNINTIIATYINSIDSQTNSHDVSKNDNSTSIINDEKMIYGNNNGDFD